MKIEQIDENKIKVILSCLDILSLDNDITELFGETTSHRLLTKILNEAFYKYGFLAKNGKIMVESFPTPKTGYVVVITKLEDERKKDFAIYVFEDFLSLKMWGIRAENFHAKKTSLYELDGKYYLLFEKNENDDFGEIQMFITDFGEKVKNECFFEGILQEYGNLLFEKNAINMLRKSYN